MWEKLYQIILDKDNEAFNEVWQQLTIEQKAILLKERAPEHLRKTIEYLRLFDCALAKGTKHIITNFLEVFEAPYPELNMREFHIGSILKKFPDKFYLILNGLNQDDKFKLITNNGRNILEDEIHNVRNGFPSVLHYAIHTNLKLLIDVIIDALTPRQLYTIFMREYKINCGGGDYDTKLLLPTLIKHGYCIIPFIRNLEPDQRYSLLTGEESSLWADGPPGAVSGYIIFDIVSKCVPEVCRVLFSGFTIEQKLTLLQLHDYYHASENLFQYIKVNNPAVLPVITEQLNEAQMMSLDPGQMKMKLR